MGVQNEPLIGWEQKRPLWAWTADQWSRRVLLRAWPTFEQAAELSTQLMRIREGRLIEAPKHRRPVVDLGALLLPTRAEIAREYEQFLARYARTF